MNIEQAIYSLLKANTAITDEVEGRIFAGIWKQEVITYPGIVYRPPPEGGKDIVRVLESGCALVRQRMHVFSAAKRFGQAAELDNAVIGCLDEYRGTVISFEQSPAESIDIQAIFLTSPAHSYMYDDRTKVHQFISVFECHYIDPQRVPTDVPLETQPKHN